MDWCIRTFSLMPLPSPWKQARKACWKMKDMMFIVSHLSGPSQDHCQQSAIPQSRELPRQISRGKWQQPQTHMQLRLIVECHWRVCSCSSRSVIIAMDNWYQQPGLRKDKLRGVDRPTPSKLPTQRHSYSHQFLYLGPSGSITKDSNSKGAGGLCPSALTRILCSLFCRKQKATTFMDSVGSQRKSGI